MARVCKRDEKSAVSLGSGMPFAIIDNGVFPRHPLVTVLLESGRETTTQPITTR